VKTRWVGPLLVAGLAMLVAACAGSPPVSRHSPAAQATATPTPAANPVLTTLTTADLSTMTSVWVKYRESGQPPSFLGYPGLYPPGSIAVGKSSATLMPGGGEWAIVTFALKDPSTATQDQLISMQDGTNVGVYFRTSSDLMWILRGLEIGGCGAIPGIGVPPAVATLLGVPDPCQ
jgi:hypothetical protein